MAIYEKPQSFKIFRQFKKCLAIAKFRLKSGIMYVFTYIIEWNLTKILQRHLVLLIVNDSII